MKRIGLLTTLVSLVALTAIAGEVERRLDVEPGGVLEVDLELGGSLKITGWEEDAVLVEAKFEGDTADGDNLVIEKTSRGAKIQTKGLKEWGDRPGVDLEIRVPSVFDLDLETMGGDIHVSGVEGDLEGETMGGDLRLEGLKGRVAFETMGGEIDLRDSEVDGSVETLGGEVLVENVTGDVDGSSMGGNVVYRNVTRRSGAATAEAVVISTMGGDLEISEAPGGARLETMGGDIRVGDAAEFIEAETMGGDIVIGSIDGWAKVETMGGDVEVTVIGDPQKDDRDIELTSMGGEIRLTVPRNFSMEVEIEIGFDPEKGGGEPQIVSAVPLTIEREDGSGGFWGKKGAKLTGRGSFNGGKNKVEIETVGGDVYLEYAK